MICYLCYPLLFDISSVVSRAEFLFYLGGGDRGNRGNHVPGRRSIGLYIPMRTPQRYMGIAPVPQPFPTLARAPTQQFSTARINPSLPIRSTSIPGIGKWTLPLAFIALLHVLPSISTTLYVDFKILITTSSLFSVCL